MTSRKLETGVRAVAVAFVVAIGLLASTPNVHGTADTRGGAPCDVNKTMYQRCGDTGYSGGCLYTYTTCYSVAGWRFMTCALKPMSSNGCEKDIARCFPRDDYAANGNCTPNYLAAAPSGAASAATAVRASQVQ